MPIVRITLSERFASSDRPSFSSYVFRGERALRGGFLALISMQDARRAFSIAGPWRRVMNWLDKSIRLLARGEGRGYYANREAASEPTALAALALLAWNRRDEASRHLQWLASVQRPRGSVGISAQQKTPGWPTPLAVAAWCAWQSHAEGRGEDRTANIEPRTSNPSRQCYDMNLRSAIRWLLKTEGKKLPRQGKKLPRQKDGHDPTLAGWPWVQDTHSWIEPTAWSVLALKAAGKGEHVRTREAVRLLVDRLLPSGGCNYGNTVVLGQQLRPHIQPTGAALLALAEETDPSGRIQRSIDYLLNELSTRTTAASLSYALLGLKSHGYEVREAETWLESAAAGALQRQSILDVALLTLAAAGEACPLIDKGTKGQRDKGAEGQK